MANNLTVGQRSICLEMKFYFDTGLPSTTLPITTNPEGDAEHYLPLS